MPQVTPDIGETGFGKRDDLPRDDRRDRAAARTCALHRQERPTSELIRFVAGPGDLVVPDLACKLPGRGVWITADRASVARATRTGAFSRSLKRRVEAPPDLADLVEEQLRRRAIQALSIANKAGLVVCGFDKIRETLERGETFALAHGYDAAAGGRQKLDAKLRAIVAASDRPATVVDCLTIDEMSLAMGRANVVHAGLKRGGASDRFVTEAKRLESYRLGVATADTARFAADSAAPGQAESGEVASGAAPAGGGPAGGDNDRQTETGEAAS